MRYYSANATSNLNSAHNLHRKGDHHGAPETDAEPVYPTAIFTLERLHAELGGAILENCQKYDELSEQMRQVEAVIKMLDPNYSLASIAVKRRKQNKWFKRGTLYRKAIDVLRMATEPMIAQELAAAILAAAGVQTPPKRRYRTSRWGYSTAYPTGGSETTG